MTIHVNIPSSLTRFIDGLKPAGRSALFSAAAAALHNLIQRHILAIKPNHHKWAQKLGANPSDNFGKAAGGLGLDHTDHSATVTIPAPGFDRAFRDVTITPKVARALTIPIHAMAYNTRVATLKRLGWIIFKPKGSNVLMGKQRSSSGDPVPLYSLRTRVTQRQDRSLLPSDAEIANAVSFAMLSTIKRNAA